MTDTTATQTVIRGLEGVVVSTTEMSKVYGDEGRLIYRGYEIADIAARTSFEEAVYLLWYGDLPNATQLAALRSELAGERSLPGAVVDMLKSQPPGTHPMIALRTAVSFLGSFDPDAGSEDAAARHRSATRLVSRMPTLVAAFERLRNGFEPITARSDLDHATNFLHMMTGTMPSDAAVRAVDAYLVLLADHGFNASTFAARVTASTMGDMYSAVTTAVGTLQGRLHGGAVERVMDMLMSVGSPDNARQWVLDALERKERIMGIGHRVYKTTDPRATVLRAMGDALVNEGDRTLFETAETIAQTAVAYFDQHRPDLKLYPNVDFYSAVVLHAAGIPTDQFTPIFAMSRVAGWSAHVMEQYSDNRLIRPRAEYVGPQGRKWRAIAER